MTANDGILAAMSPLAVLLRVLLCLALILNGSASVAHAAMAGAASHDAPVVDARVADRGADMAMGEGGCHDGAMAHDAPPADTPPAPDHDSGCCGGEGDCRSACAQHCTVSIAGIASLNLTLPPAAGLLLMAPAAHPAPRLRDRIRPPIG